MLPSTPTNVALLLLSAAFFFAEAAARVAANVRLARASVGVTALSFSLLLFTRGVLRGGALNARYCTLASAAVLASLAADVVLVSPGEVGVAPALLLYLAAALFLAGAFSAPTLPRAIASRVSGERLLIDFFGRTRESTRVNAATWRAAAVPLHALSRGLVVAGAAAAAIVILNGHLDAAAAPYFWPLSGVLVAVAVAVQRALARVGYFSARVTVESILQVSADALARASAWAATLGGSPEYAASGDGGFGGFGVDDGGIPPKSPSSPAPRRRALSASASESASLLAAENRLQQWAAVGSVLAFSVAWGLSVLWWLPPIREGTHLPTATGDRSAGPGAVQSVCIAALSYLARLLLVASAPGDWPNASQLLPVSLEDTNLCPLPLRGRSPLAVLVILPGGDAGFDAAEVAPIWYYLTRRGHAVTFAVPAIATVTAHAQQRSRGGGAAGLAPLAAAKGAPLSAAPETVAGYGGCLFGSEINESEGVGSGCCSSRRPPLSDEGVCSRFLRDAWRALACSPHEVAGYGAPPPAVLAMYAAMRKSSSLRSPVSFRTMASLPAVSTQYQGVIVVGATGTRGVEGPGCAWEDPTMLSILRYFLDSARPVAVLSTAVSAVARLSSAQTGKAYLHGRRVAAPLPASQWTDAILRVCCGCNWHMLSRLRTAAAEAKLAVDVAAGACGSRAFVVTRAAGVFADDTLLGAALDVCSSGRLVLPGFSPLLPLSAERDGVVDEDGALVSAQSAADALLLARRFVEKLEASSVGTM